MKLIQKAQIEIGNVKTTPNQRKKLYTQFTKRDKATLETAVKKMNIKSLWSSKHLNKKNTITYSRSDVEEVLKNHNIIEYNLTQKGERYDKRVVLRGTKVVATDEGNMNLCVVISLKNNAMVTAYYCSSDKETHTNIHMDRYDKDLRVIL